MDKIVDNINITSVLTRLNDVRLYHQVSRLSDIATDDGSFIHKWALYGPPSPSSLGWPKRRIPLDHNMKLWRDTIRRLFFSANGIYPKYLEAITKQPMETVMLRYVPRFQDILEQLDACYRIMLGNNLLYDDAVEQIVLLLMKGQLYAGSDGSVKDERGAHAYGFTSGKDVGEIWGDSSITPGSKR